MSGSGIHNNEHWKSLTEESSVDLIRRIVENSDRLALKVLLDTRRLFHLRKDEQPLLFPEFLMELRDRLCSADKVAIGEIDVADCAYDLSQK